MSDNRIRYMIIGRVSQDIPHEIINIFFSNLSSNVTPNTTVLSKDDLNNISEKKYSEISTEENTCSICLNIIKQDEIIRQLDCKHVFHTKCIEKYLLEYNCKCPLCRKDVV
jgi:hypothetical protein